MNPSDARARMAILLEWWSEVSDELNPYLTSDDVREQYRKLKVSVDNLLIWETRTNLIVNEEKG